MAPGPPSAGEVHFLGEDVTRHKPFERVLRGMSIKMQVPSVFRELPAIQNLVIALQQRLSRAEESDDVARHVVGVTVAGVLMARVTQVKRKGAARYVGIETGMNSLLRPALYGAYHEIVNLTRLDEPLATTVDIVGPICETGDVLGYGRRLPETAEGDIILIATAGAYGRVMSSQYNLREPAPEVVLEPRVVTSA